MYDEAQRGILPVSSIQVAGVEAVHNPGMTRLSPQGATTKRAGAPNPGSRLFRAHYPSLAKLWSRMHIIPTQRVSNDNSTGELLNVIGQTVLSPKSDSV